MHLNAEVFFVVWRNTFKKFQVGKYGVNMTFSSSCSDKTLGFKIQNFSGKAK